MIGQVTTLPEPPATLSGLIRLGNKDGRELDHAKYEPDANIWHREEAHPEKTSCYVCWAGSIMAGTLGIKDDLQLEPDDFTLDWQAALLALECVRKGELFNAASYLDLLPASSAIMAALQVLEQESEELWFYTSGGEQRYGEFIGWDEYLEFMDKMDVLADSLEEIGL